MKNLINRIIMSSFLGLSLGNVSGVKAQFSGISYSTFIADMKKVEVVVGYRKSEEIEKCEWSHIIIEPGKIEFVNQINKNKERVETIITNSDNTISYEICYLNRSIEDCKAESWDERTIIYEINHKKQENFPIKDQERINKLMDMNVYCNIEWINFLRHETDKWSKTYLGRDVPRLDVSYKKINEKGIPKEVRIWGGEINGFGISQIKYEDTNNDGKYDDISLKTFIEGDKWRSERIKLNYEKKVIDYFVDYPSLLDLKNKKIEEFSPELQTRIGNIQNLKIDCSKNEAIKFLYGEYYKWSEE